MSYGRLYRKRLSTGVVPPGDGAWCVHCDEWHREDDYTNADTRSTGRIPCNGPEACKCSCHTKKRKPKCLCAVKELTGPWDSPIGCCMDCDCYCHRAEVKEHERTRVKRAALWAAELDRQEKERFNNEGVHDWEKKVLEYVMYDPTNLNYKYSSFMEVLSYSSHTTVKKAPDETGAMFIDRMLRTPWGSKYIKEHSSSAHTKILNTRFAPQVMNER